jgi:hypothetical protein
MINMTEQDRGYKEGKKYMRNFRSFKRDERTGDIVAYTYSGSKRIMSRKGARAGSDKFSRGWMKAEKEALKEKKTRTVKRNPNRTSNKNSDWSWKI